MVERKQLAEISHVYTETVRILKVVSRVGPSCIEDHIPGIDCGEIARDVADYAQLINEHQSHFQLANTNHARSLSNKLHPKIENFSSSINSDDILSTGREIYYLINKFLPRIKLIADEKENTTTTE